MEAAFTGEKLDRVPVFLILGGHLAKEAGFTSEKNKGSKKSVLVIA